MGFVGYGASSGGCRAVEQLRQVFPELRATTIREAVLLNRPWERCNQEGRFIQRAEESAALQATIEELGWWARALRDGRDRRRGAA